MKIALGTDHAGYEYKEKIKEYLLEQGHEIEDFGTHSTDSVDYPLYIRPAAEAVARGACDRGIVLGGSGNGEAMAANRVPGVRCALCWNLESAVLARRHNDSNVLSLGARMISLDLALEIVRTWLETDFEQGRHVHRIQLLDAGQEASTSKKNSRQKYSKVPDKAVEPSGEAYDVVISFGYILYSEGKRSIELRVEPGLKHPTIIQVPSASRWEAEMPEWCRGRREEILSRIRSKCAHLECEWKEY
ncbi:MAG: ribose 5-phosphate isomerase B [Desulfatiglandales bacterium]